MSGLPKQGFKHKSSNSSWKCCTPAGDELQKTPGAQAQQSWHTPQPWRERTVPYPSSHPSCLVSKWKTTKFLQVQAEQPCHGVFFTFYLLAPVMNYGFDIVMLQSTALDESRRINHLLFYKQESQKCVTVCEAHIGQLIPWPTNQPCSETTSRDLASQAKLPPFIISPNKIKL